MILKINYSGVIYSSIYCEGFIWLKSGINTNCKDILTFSSILIHYLRRHGDKWSFKEKFSISSLLKVLKIHLLYTKMQAVWLYSILPSCIDTKICEVGLLCEIHPLLRCKAISKCYYRYPSDPSVSLMSRGSSSNRLTNALMYRYANHMVRFPRRRKKTGKGENFLPLPNGWIEEKCPILMSETDFSVSTGSVVVGVSKGYGHFILKNPELWCCVCWCSTQTCEMLAQIFFSALSAYTIHTLASLLNVSPFKLFPWEIPYTLTVKVISSD